MTVTNHASSSLVGCYIDTHAQILPYKLYHNPALTRIANFCRVKPGRYFANYSSMQAHSIHCPQPARHPCNNDQLQEGNDCINDYLYNIHDNQPRWELADNDHTRNIYSEQAPGNIASIRNNPNNRTNYATGTWTSPEKVIVSNPRPNSTLNYCTTEGEPFYPNLPYNLDD